MLSAALEWAEEIECMLTVNSDDPACPRLTPETFTIHTKALLDFALHRQTEFFRFCLTWPFCCCNNLTLRYGHAWLTENDDHHFPTDPMYKTYANWYVLIDD